MRKENIGRTLFWMGLVLITGAVAVFIYPGIQEKIPKLAAISLLPIGGLLSALGWIMIDHVKKSETFSLGDRVKVRTRSFLFPILPARYYLGGSLVYYFLQKDNLIGTIREIAHEYNGETYYLLRMDKPVKDSFRGPYTYCAYDLDLKLIEPAKFQKPFNVWDIQPSKVEQEAPDESIPDVWRNRVLVREGRRMR